MTTSALQTRPSDQVEREQALDPRKSVLVQAPAGSGKTDLLTRRFLRLLAEVNDPAEIVAITFTIAAAAEMRHRILSELEKAASDAANQPMSAAGEDPFAMATLAARALARSRQLGWNLTELPSQLRISTIDSFCRDIAIQEPVLSGMGGDLEISENPAELYHLAARRTLEMLESTNDGTTLAAEIEHLLQYRDNGWRELQGLLVEMLRRRDAWMQDFWLGEFGPERTPDWEALRAKLELPFRRAAEQALRTLDAITGPLQPALEEALYLARFACEQSGLHRELAELRDFPCGPYQDAEEVEKSRCAYLCLAKFLLTQSGEYRKRPNKSFGFPADRPEEKERYGALVERLAAVPGLASLLAQIQDLPPVHYSQEDWETVRACFTLLRRAAAELRVAFAEAGLVDFIEVSQIAQRVLLGADAQPSDAALALADGIHHMLVDEFQDTSRRQHTLIASIVGAWSDPEQRSLFVVGDPMQSIYFFRDADAELFPRVRSMGLELPAGEALPLHYVPLRSNFRTARELVQTLNRMFSHIFGEEDGSGVQFAAAEPARNAVDQSVPRFHLHTEFMPRAVTVRAGDAASAARKREVAEEREQAKEKQLAEMLSLIRGHFENAQEAARRGERYRIAVLGRTRAALAPVARILREGAIPFRAVDLEQLEDRPEIQDVLALARAALNPEDRVAWLGVLRAPWCGLSLTDLHTLASQDDPQVLARPIPSLLQERSALLSDYGQKSVARLLASFESAAEFRVDQPTAALGTWLQRLWLQLGGDGCVDPVQRANVHLLWSCLDRLQGGEPDLLGPGLSAALESLTAEPDPAANPDCGVHVMTIHKSKGLEFEVVIVPELQAGCGRSNGALMSWLERGLSSPERSGAITEFLVAPVPAKGTTSSPTRKWVDRERRMRESQETRRILYVAATRAREELHLFARPEFKTAREGEAEMCETSDSLLATAWPALVDTLRSRFDQWNRRDRARTVQTLAAATGDLFVMHPARKLPVLRRLPAAYQVPMPERRGRRQDTQARASDLGAGYPAASHPDEAQTEAYTRHEGGDRSRALGIAVHLLLEELARLRSEREWPASLPLLSRHVPRAISRLRAFGWTLEQAQVIADEALGIVRTAANDPHLQWVLSPHTDAASEVRWIGVIDDRLREVRVDRVFRGGAEPGSSGDDTWWIIDFKTAVAESGDRASLAALRTRFAPQLEFYATVLRQLHGPAVAVRAALYYPRMAALDWWAL